MLQETIGIIIFSGFMVCLVGVLVGHVCLALYKERKARRNGQGDPRAD